MQIRLDFSLISQYIVTSQNYITHNYVIFAMEEIEQDQKVTHYLTYCNIYASQKLFQDYQSFLQKLVIQLGEDWRIQSNILWDGQENGEGYPHIFNIFLSVFLESRLNKEYCSDVVIDSDQMVEQQKSIERFNFVKMNESKNNEGGKVSGNIGESLTFQTLSVGFFVTAAEIWNTLFMQGRKPYKEKAYAELKPFATSIQYEPSETIKKLRKLSNDVSKGIKSRLQNSEFVSHSQSRFSREVSTSHILSKTKDSVKNVSWKGFKPSIEEIPPSLLARVKEQLEVKQQYSVWQVLSNFMVNVLEVKQKNQKHERMVRIIRVNRQFYHTTTVIWLLINNKKNYLMKYSEYENFVVSIIGEKWKSEYSSTLKLLFDILTKEWNQITKEHAINLNEDYEVMKIFIERLKKSLGSAWNSILGQINMELLQL